MTNLVQEHYAILFNSESDKGEEILVSILADNHAKVSIHHHQEQLQSIIGEWHESKMQKSLIELIRKRLNGVK